MRIGNVATSGQVNAARGAAEVKAALNGLAKGLADLGVSASENTSSSSYEGVVQQELPTALRDVRECKLRVFQTLQEKLSPDARSTPVRTRSRRHKNWIAAATRTTSSPLQYSMYSPRCRRKTLPSTRTNGVIA